MAFRCAPGYTLEPSGCCAKVGVGGAVMRSCPGSLSPQQVATVVRAPGALQPTTPTCPPGKILDKTLQICVDAPVAVQPPPSPAGAAKMATSAPIITMAGATQKSILGDILGAALPVIGGAIGGPAGAAIGGAVGGALTGHGGGGGGTAVATGIMPGGSASPCPTGYMSTPLGCVATSPTAYLPGGAPATLPQSGTQVADYGAAVMGRYGAGLQPAVYSTQRRRCPRGTVLGDDGLCYDKGKVRGHRMWPYHRPPVTRGDFNAIRKADRARKTLVGLTKKAGAFAAMKKPRQLSGSRGVITKSEAARALRR